MTLRTRHRLSRFWTGNRHYVERAGVVFFVAIVLWLAVVTHR